MISKIALFLFFLLFGLVELGLAIPAVVVGIVALVVAVAVLIDG